MSKLLHTINEAREMVIHTHYSACIAQIKDYVAKSPLKTEFYVTAGCVSEQITNEIAHRLNQEGIIATPTYSGIFTTKYYIHIKVKLPEVLVHEKAEEVIVKEENILDKVEAQVEEKKVEQTKVEEKELSAGEKATN